MRLPILPPSDSIRPRAMGTAYLAAKAPNTRKAYRDALADFARWIGREVEPGMITDAALCGYILSRGESHRPATVTSRVARLRELARDMGFMVTGDHHADALKALRREKGIAQKQAKGLSLPAYRTVLETTGEDAAGLRDRVFLTLAYGTAARVSELLSYRFEDIDEEAGLILLRRSKTDQEGLGTSLHLSPDARSALRAWRAMVAAQGVAAQGPLLRGVNKGGRIGEGLSLMSASRIVKRLLGDDYSSHSFRVGLVQEAVGAGLSIPQIALTTRQSPATIARYAAKTDQRNSAAAKLLG